MERRIAGVDAGIEFRYAIEAHTAVADREAIRLRTSSARIRMLGDSVESPQD